MTSSYQMPDAVVHILVTDRCQLKCLHCYSAKGFSGDVSSMQLESFSSELKKFLAPGSFVEIRWHGGEPTALGIPYLEALFDVIDAQTEFQWLHTMQTNLIEYSAELRDFTHRRLNGKLGVSWDYKMRFLTGSTDAYEKRFWSNVSLAVSDGIELSAIITLSKLLISKHQEPTSLIRQFAEAGFRSVLFIALNPVGIAHETWSTIGLSNTEQSRWLARAMRSITLYRKQESSEVPIELEPFDGVLLALKDFFSGTLPNGWSSCGGLSQTRRFTYDSTGFRLGCSGINGGYSTLTAAETAECHAADADCRSCEFLAFCRGGCRLRKKASDDDECSGFKTFLLTTKKLLEIG